MFCTQNMAHTLETVAVLLRSCQGACSGALQVHGCPGLLRPSLLLMQHGALGIPGLSWQLCVDIAPTCRGNRQDVQPRLDCPPAIPLHLDLSGGQTGQPPSLSALLVGH